MWAAILEIVCYLATQLASEASASKLLRLPEITVLTITNGKLWREICQKLLPSQSLPQEDQLSLQNVRSVHTVLKKLRYHDDSTTAGWLHI